MMPIYDQVLEQFADIGAVETMHMRLVEFADSAIVR